jgi:cation:H+ antiporter
MGTCLLLALGQVIAIVEKGYITRPNALILVGSWPLYMLLTRATEHAPPIDEFVPTEEAQNRWYSGLVTVVGLVGVAGGAYVVIQAVIRLSTNLHIPEYFISFFAVSIGTSMPELCVDLAALRRKEYQIVMGDIFGSCIVDATLSIGIGQVFFPQEISGALALNTVDYMLLATLIVVAVLSWRRTVDRKAGVLFIVLYLLSYAFLFI